MAIDLIGNPGGLFRRLGLVLTSCNDCLALAGSIELPDADLPGSGCVPFRLLGSGQLISQFQTAEGSDFALIYPILSSYQTTSSQFLGQMSQFAQVFIIDQANRQLSPPLTALSFTQAWLRLVAQMQASGDTVKAPTVSIGGVAKNAANHGNAVVVASLLQPNGLKSNAPYSEQIQVVCAADSQSGTAVNSEELVAAGQVSSSTGSRGWSWPQGSGTSLAVNLTNPSTTASNKLTNADFESGFVAGIPSGWAATAGAAQIADGGAQALFGSHCVQYTGDGVTLTGLQQTLSGVQPYQVYAFNFWVRTSGTPAAGRLQFALCDSTGAVINNAQSVANAITIDLTQIAPGTYQAVAQMGGSWVVSGSVWFQTPAILPSQVNFKMSLTTALSAGKFLWIDFGGLCTPAQLYTGGPYVAAFPGNTPIYVGDNWTFSVTNLWDAKFVRGCERLFSLRLLGWQYNLPVSGSPTVPESLVP